MKNLLAVLRYALLLRGNPNIKRTDVLSILREAEKQTVIGIVFNEIGNRQLAIDKEKVFEYIGLIQQIEQQNRLQNAVLKELSRLMDTHGVRYAIVKGQIAGLNYPEPLIRQSGDIDIYCAEDDFQNAKTNIEKEWGVEFRGDANTHHHIEVEYKGVPIELHHKLIKLYSKKKDFYWKKICQQSFMKVDIGGVEVYILTPTLHVLYIFLHLYHHLLELGVGLRQFCDWAMMLHSKESEIDFLLLRKHLVILGMERAYRACGVVLVDGLGLKEKEIGYILSKKDRYYGKKIIDIVAYRGNMGKYNKKLGFNGVMHKLEAAGIKMSHFIKLWRLAPSYSLAWIWSEFWREI